MKFRLSLDINDIKKIEFTSLKVITSKIAQHMRTNINSYLNTVRSKKSGYGILKKCRTKFKLECTFTNEILSVLNNKLFETNG